MGTAQRMGPAYFPTVLGGLLARWRLVIAIQALRNTEPGGDVERFHFGPLLIVLGAVALFGRCFAPAGLVIALLVLIVMSAYASHEFRLREIAPAAPRSSVLLVLAGVRLGAGRCADTNVARRSDALDGVPKDSDGTAQQPGLGLATALTLHNLPTASSACSSAR